MADVAYYTCEVLFAPGTIQAATPAQIEAIDYLASSADRKLLHVMVGGFSLPDGYLSFRYDYSEKVGGGSIYGGIDPEGQVST